LISVVIPLFNKEPYIKRAIDSVLSQIFQDFEVIVVDDGSTDGGAGVGKGFKDLRVKLVHQENEGASAARNRGIEQAQGELIAFLDADDAWKPGFLKEIVDLRRRFPKAGAYATAWEMVCDDGKIIRPEFRFLQPQEQQGLMNFFVEGALRIGIISSAVAVPKSVLQRFGGFRVGETRSEDRDLWLKIAIHYPIAWSNECLAVYYTDTVDRSIIKTGRLFSPREPALSRTAREAMQSGNLTPSQINQLRELVAIDQMLAARHYLLQGAKKEALQLLAYARGTVRYQQEWKWHWTLLARLPGNCFLLYEKIKRLESRLRRKVRGKNP
jgi:glycosyltransferase involved in cell wall biosynthesis